MRDSLLSGIRLTWGEPPLAISFLTHFLAIQLEFCQNIVHIYGGVWQAVAELQANFSTHFTGEETESWPCSRWKDPQW